MAKRQTLALLLIATGVVAGWQAMGIRVDNRLERWLGDGGREDVIYREFRRQFGSDEFLLARIGGGDFFAADTLDAMLTAAENLEAIPGVVEVRGIATVYRDLFGAEDPEALAEEVRSTPFYDGLFMSADGELASLLVEVEPAPDAGARRELVDAAELALEPLRATGRDVRLVGSPALIAALDEVSRHEAQRTIPIALAGSLLALAVLLRSVRAMLATAASALLAVIITLGFAAGVGVSLNMVSTALPPLLWVLALSNSIHIMRRYQDLRIDTDADEALAAALRDTTRPCTLAAVTTAAGFGSLAVAVMEPVRELGWLAAFGILISLAVNLTVTPLLVKLLAVPPFRRHLALKGRWLLVGVDVRPRTVLALTGAFLVLAAVVIPRIQVESNPLAFLPPDHATTRDFRSLDDRLGGFYTLELVLEAPDAWYAPEVRPTLQRVADEVAASPIVTRVLSPVDLLSKLNQWHHGLDPTAYRPPGSRDEARELVESADATARRSLARLVGEDGRTVRLSALVNELHEQRFLELVEEARRSLNELPQGWNGEVTGQVLLLVEAQQRLVATQLRSLGLALVLVFAVLGVGLGSLRLLGLAVPPNLLPIIAAFAAMAVLDLPLDAGTVMVASIALGIAVDNTVHVLANVHRRLGQGAPVVEAIRRTLQDIGPAMVATTATACVGFLALATSDFVPIRDFGILATVAMAAALVADLVVLPALLVAVGGRR